MPSAGEIVRADDSGPGDGQSAMASSGPDMDAGNVLAFRRGFVAVLNVNAVTVGVIGSGATLFTLPAGYRPVDTIFGTIVNATTGAIVRVHANTNGTVTTQAALASGDLLRGSFDLPLPL